MRDRIARALTTIPVLGKDSQQLLLAAGSLVRVGRSDHCGGHELLPPWASPDWPWIASAGYHDLGQVVTDLHCQFCEPIMPMIGLGLKTPALWLGGEGDMLAIACTDHCGELGAVGTPLSTLQLMGRVLGGVER